MCAAVEKLASCFVHASYTKLTSFFRVLERNASIHVPNSSLATAAGKNFEKAPNSKNTFIATLIGWPIISPPEWSILARASLSWLPRCARTSKSNDEAREMDLAKDAGTLGVSPSFCEAKVEVESANFRFFCGRVNKYFQVASSLICVAYGAWYDLEGLTNLPWGWCTKKTSSSRAMNHLGRTTWRLVRRGANPVQSAYATVFLALM